MSLRCLFKGHDYGPWTPYYRIRTILGMLETERKRIDVRWCNHCTAEQERPS